VREGDWKLIEFFEENRAELYDLKSDLRESQDLAAKMPEKTAALRQKLAGWRKQVGAQMPLPNSEAGAVEEPRKKKKKSKA
jgi:arylsulfatase A-like enzyme